MAEVQGMGNFDTSGGKRLLGDVIERLHREIAYYLAEERRSEIFIFDAEELVVAVDLLALMAERYQMPPGIRDATVRRWRDMYINVFDRRYEYNPAEHTSGWIYERRNVILSVFNRLETAAHLRPPSPDWDALAAEEAS